VQVESRKRQYILAAGLLLIGLLLILPLPSFRMSSFVLFICGVVLLLGYKTKRNSLVLIFGGFLTYLGAMQILQMFIPNGDNGLLGTLFRAMWFIVPGTVFMVLYFDKGKRGLLVPASILIWTGIYTFVRALPIIGTITGGFALFALFAGLAFFTVYVLSDKYGGKWPLYIAFFGVGYFVAVTAAALLISLGTVIGVLILMLGLYVLFKELKK